MKHHQTLPATTPTHNAFPGFSSLAAGPEAPLEMLAACHEKIRQQCATLQRLVAHIETRGIDADARQAASNILRYFETAGKLHHQDEEEDIFPALIESMTAQEAVHSLHPENLMQTLSADHRTQDALWLPLRNALTRIARGEQTTLTATDVLPWLTQHAQHLQQEDDVLLPMAKRLLSNAALEKIGRAMCARRGVGFAVDK